MVYAESSAGVLAGLVALVESVVVLAESVVVVVVVTGADSAKNRVFSEDATVAVSSCNFFILLSK